MTLPLRVNVAPERADASPGDNLQFDVTVRNASDIVEHYGVELLGLPDGATVRTEPEVAKLRPAESGTLIVKVNLPVQPPAPAGTYVVGALVRSKYRHDVSRCVEVPIELASVEAITLRTTPEVVTGGGSGQYSLEVSNGGNAPVRLYLTATDPERRVSAVFQPGWLDLPPGTTARALLDVSAPVPWNKEKQRQLTLAATPDLPGATPITGTATFVQQPRIASKFIKIAGIAAGVVVLAAAIAVPTLLTKTKDEPDPAAGQQPAVVPTAAAPATQQSAAAPPAQAPSAAAPPAQPSAAAPTSAAAATTTTAPPAGRGAREVDLTTPPPGAVASDFFRNDGFLVSADPNAIVVAGCENARSAAVVDDPTGKFMTSALPDDPTRCHEVPLLIDFLQDTPAGAIQVVPLTPNTLTMEVTFRDLSRQTVTNLTVPADQGAAKGGIDQVLLKSSIGPVAVTKLRLAPLT
ncbi:hypothetical protein GCM10010172_61010 [Paractinoplanes ferrugineus]|uniref:Uncharacterized protein n=1 Tax=Paractinoplanes ferrugineus TaxID=113564 RepID=A0A919JCD1_9ACTN|nr:hypothetical protein [Actinoplanes ferrugineus]GIE14571.1 hypothetical protein Afe05nite_64110 [Actinoplanes ferrugineus]